MGLFSGSNDESEPTQVSAAPAEDDAPAIEDTGVVSDGPLVVLYDLEDEVTYSFPASRMVYVRDYDEDSDDEAEGALAVVRFLDEDGYADSSVSTPPAGVRKAWLEARVAERS